MILQFPLAACLRQVGLYIVLNEFEIGPDPAWTAELAALDQLKKSVTYLRTIQNILMTCWLSGERSLPFGLLVVKTSLSPLLKSAYLFLDL